MVKQYWWKLYTWRTWHSITPWFHIILDINASQLAPQVALIVKNPPSSAGDVRDVGSISGSGRSPGGGMATHSSILSWRIPWTEESGRLWSIGSQRVGHDWSDVHACTATTAVSLESPALAEGFFTSSVTWEAHCCGVCLSYKSLCLIHLLSLMIPMLTVYQ